MTTKNHFGASVIGEEAARANEQAAAEGSDVFGARVRGDIQHETNPDEVAKANSEFGGRVAVGAKPTELSEEEIRRILDPVTGNPTLLDSMYEGELARAGGPRKEVVRFMLEVERGIKGAMRPGIMSQMRRIIGEESGDAAAATQARDEMVKHDEEVQKRSEENLLLRDAGRVKALAERSENLQKIEAAGGDSTQLSGGGPQETPSLADLTQKNAATSSTSSTGTAARTSTSSNPAPGGSEAAPGSSTPAGQPAGSEAGTGEGDENDSTDATSQQVEEIESMTRAELEAKAEQLGVNLDDGRGELTDGKYSVDQIRAKLIRKVKRTASSEE